MTDGQNTDVVAIEDRPEIAEAQTRAKTLAANAARIVVKDDASAQRATDFLVGVKNAQKETEALRKSITQPILDSKKKIDKLFKRVMQPFADAETVVKGKMRDYHLEQERIRRAEEERIRKEAEEREAERERIATEAAEKGEPIPEEPEEPEPIEAAPEPAKTHRGMEGGSASMKSVWKFQIVKREDVPFPAYWLVDEKEIRKAVAAGVRDIPGVRIYEDVDVSVRT